MNENPIDTPVSIAFFGTPDYAVPTLRALATNPAFAVRMVVTQPDRPAGRGHALVPPPVKDEAITLGLPILQPSTLRDEEARSILRGLNVDLFVVAAYGLIFSQAVLDIPRLGSLNLHASLLPSYRGAAPITAAILNGDDVTGVTLMEMERGLDTGPTLASATSRIDRRDTTETLTRKLADVAADLAIMAIPPVAAGEIQPVPQPTGATAVRQLTKADGEIDWTLPAVQIERHIRAMWPWPRAWSRAGETVVQIHAAIAGDSIGLAPGELAVSDGEPLVGTGGGSIVIRRAQMPGGRPQEGVDLARSGKLLDGKHFSPSHPVDSPLIRRVN